MTLVKWMPKRNMLNIFDDVEQVVNQMFGYSDGGSNNSKYLNPEVNINEKDEEYNISLDLPGVEKKDVSVSFNDGILTVSGERKYENELNGQNNILQEKLFGKFERSFKMTRKILQDKIKARFRNGVLNIVVPKSEEVKSSIKNIAVS